MKKAEVKCNNNIYYLSTVGTEPLKNNVGTDPPKNTVGTDPFKEHRGHQAPKVHRGHLSPKEHRGHQSPKEHRGKRRGWNHRAASGLGTWDFFLGRLTGIRSCNIRKFGTRGVALVHQLHHTEGDGSDLWAGVCAADN